MRLTATYVFYADVYFVQNLLLKVTVLYLALYVNKQNLRVNPIKILVAGVFGTLLEILGLMWSQNFSFFIGLINLVEIPWLIFFLLSRKEEKLRKGIWKRGCEWGIWLQVSISALFFVIVVNGVIEAGYNLFGEVGHFIELVLLSCGIVGIGTRQFLQYRKIQKGIYPTRLIYKGRKVDCRGFYDSGNTLRDPYTGVGVHIISKEVKNKLKITGEKGLLIPYSSLGNENNLMMIYYMDKMITYGRNQTVEQSHVAVGIGEEGLFYKKPYDVILNENIW